MQVGQIQQGLTAWSGPLVNTGKPQGQPVTSGSSGLAQAASHAAEGMQTAARGLESTAAASLPDLDPKKLEEMNAYAAAFRANTNVLDMIDRTTGELVAAIA